ncbi:uncharacterized protein [Dendropsophus ebraccatus]|uniref:uncharacterized protein n=1 Tax=Dendropsophus ebraccatus TaxID=150705 RepID=UPI0038314B11
MVRGATPPRALTGVECGLGDREAPVSTRRRRRCFYLVAVVTGAAPSSGPHSTPVRALGRLAPRTKTPRQPGSLIIVFSCSFGSEIAMLAMKSVESVLLSLDIEPWIEKYVDFDDGPNEIWISEVQSAPHVFSDGLFEKNLWTPCLRPIDEIEEYVDFDDGPDDKWISEVQSAPHMFRDGLFQKNLWAPRLRPIEEESLKELYSDMVKEQKIKRKAEKKRRRERRLARMMSIFCFCRPNIVD